jgi:hypothetical protein
LTHRLTIATFLINDAAYLQACHPIAPIPLDHQSITPKPKFMKDYHKPNISNIDLAFGIALITASIFSLAYGAPHLQSLIPDLLNATGRAFQEWVYNSTAFH